MRSRFVSFAALMAVAGCSHASTTHAPSSASPAAIRDEAMARRVELGPLDEPLGDPDAERSRLRAFLADPTVGGELRLAARGRLEAIHSAALADEQVDHGAALTRFREDLPQLLVVSEPDENSGAEGWVTEHFESFVAKDPELYAHAPEAVARALASMDERSAWGEEFGDPSPADESIRRFAATLPPPLRARAAAVGVIRDLSVFEDASIARLGEPEWSTLVALLDRALDAGALERAKLVAERLVAIEPSAFDARIALAALSRRLPVHLRMAHDGSRDARDLVRLAFDLRWDQADHPVERLEIMRLASGDVFDVKRLLLPLTNSGDEDVRAIAVDYLAALDAPEASGEDDAGAREAALEAVRRERDDCRDVYARPWNAPEHCLTDDRIDHVLERLASVPLPSARRALAWLESIEASDLRFRPKYTELRIELAIANGDFDLADRFLAERGRLLSSGVRVLLRLRVLDARRGEDATDRADGFEGMVDLVARNALVRVFGRAWQAMSSSHCGLPEDLREAEPAIASAEVAFVTDVTDPRNASVARLENVATLVDRRDAPYVYALVLATAANAGDFERVRSLERGIHALAPDSFVDLLAAFTRALADRDLPATEGVLRRVRLVAPETEWPRTLEDPLRDLRPDAQADTSDVDGCDDCESGEDTEEGGDALETRLSAFGASELDTLLARESLSHADDYEPPRSTQARVDRFLGGNGRGPGALAIRCYVGAALVDHAWRYGVPSDPPGNYVDRMEDRESVARRAVDVCARAVAQHSDDVLLASWARAVLGADTLDEAAKRAFLRATESSTLPAVLIARIRIVHELERAPNDVFEAIGRYLSLHGLDDLSRWTSIFRIPTLTREMNVASLYFGFEGVNGELFRGEYERVLARGVEDSFGGFLASDAVAHRLDDAGVREFVAFHMGSTYARYHWDGHAATDFLDRHPESLSAQLFFLQFVATQPQESCPSRERCLGIASAALAAANRPVVVAVVARALLGLGDRDRARSAVVQALAANPDDEMLRHLLEEDCR